MSQDQRRYHIAQRHKIILPTWGGEHCKS